MAKNTHSGYSPGMERTGHVLAGIGGAVAVGAVLWGQSPLSAITAAGMVVPGSTAPDWLEGSGGGRAPIIKHRTITHWPIVYLLMMAAFFLSTLPSLVQFAAFGFCIGALIHLSGDMMTPSGIPLLLPTRKVSLVRFWGRRSAQARWVLLYAAFGCAALYLRAHG
jgi:membrane-bound metal-dependent hydrolase YbcI (DUF457 family)